MTTYRCLADIQGKTLKCNDTVILRDIKYTVKQSYLEECHTDNDKIFRILSIPSKETFATNAYGYESLSGIWPECKKQDYEALTKCVIELYKIIEGVTTITSEKEQWYKITAPGETGISPEQVEELIIKYGGIINPSYNYKCNFGAYYWKKDKLVNFATDFTKSAIEVSPTTEIITTKKEEKYENQFQRKKACIKRGTRPEGNTICGRRGKASITVGHLGYRKVTGI